MAAQKNVPLTADELMKMVFAHCDKERAEFAHWRRGALLTFAGECAKKFAASPRACAELVNRMLANDPTNVEQVIPFADQCTLRAKRQIFEMMFRPFSTPEAAVVIDYAQRVLERDLTSDELRKLSRQYTGNDSGKNTKSQKDILEYLKRRFPTLLKTYEEYFRKEKEFWDGLGSII